MQLHFFYDFMFNGVHDKAGGGFRPGFNFESISDGFNGPRTQVNEVCDFLGTFFFAHEAEDGGFFIVELCFLRSELLWCNGLFLLKIA